MFINLSLESSAQNIADNVQSTEKPRRKPTLRDIERLKTFNAKKAAAATENIDANSEESSEFDNFVEENGASGNQRTTPTDEDKDMRDDVTTEKPVESEVATVDSENSENKPDNVPPLEWMPSRGINFCVIREAQPKR